MRDHLFIYSMSDLFSLIFPILEHVQARSIAELSAKDIENSQYLHSWLSVRQGELMVLDDQSSQQFQTWSRTVRDVVTHVEENSLTAIEKLPAIDAWFLHGNCNWFTVYHELRAIYAAAKKHQKPMIALIHDVAWPCARRDWYSTPERIPESFRQPFSRDYSVATDEVKIMEGREKSEAYAVTEGNQRNGVLTAVEDFVAEHADEFYWGFIPSVFGLGILFDRSHPQAVMIANSIAPYHEQPLLAKLEQNRIANYLMNYDLKKAKTKKATDFSVEESFQMQDFLEMRASVLRLLEMLGDEEDHPEIWNIFKTAAESDGRESLIALANYIDELLDAPQPAHVARILSVVHAVCAGYLGNHLFACKKLEELALYYPATPLAQGALGKIQSLEGVCE